MSQRKRSSGVALAVLAFAGMITLSGAAQAASPGVDDSSPIFPTECGSSQPNSTVSFGFSGTHFGHPRLVSLRVKLTFR